MKNAWAHFDFWKEIAGEKAFGAGSFCLYNFVGLHMNLS